jgi:hypothetical protein
MRVAMNTEDVIRAALDECLSSGNYAQLFLNDLIDLATHQNNSPEVIFQEIRIMEGKEDYLMTELDVESYPIWFGSYESTFNRSPSATKDSLEFKRLPLKGLQHKHYYIPQDEFTAININNQNKKYPNYSQFGAMIARITEGGLTGEWIIFKKADGVNTYLCLAKHTDGDKATHNRLIANGLSWLNTT